MIGERTLRLEVILAAVLAGGRIAAYLVNSPQVEGQVVLATVDLVAVRADELQTEEQ